MGSGKIAAEETAWLELKHELEAKQLLEPGARRNDKLLPGKSKKSCEHGIAG